MRDFEREIDTLREKLEAGERGGDDADCAALLEFSDTLRLLRTEYADSRHVKLLRHCIRMSEHADGLADVVDDRDACERVVRWIHAEYDNEETNRDYRSALRVFAKRVTEGDGLPDAVEWVPTGTSNSYDPIPPESEMLEWDEARAMIDATQNPRDAALIAVQFDAGLRSGELETLTVGDVFDSEHAMGVHVDGKQGERDVHLIPSIPYLQQWLADPRCPDDGDARLWAKLGAAEPISYTAFLDAFKKAGRRAEIDKPVTPTNFRKSNMRWLVRKGMSQPDIEDRQGRARGSKHTARYMARFGSESSERRYAAVHGLDVETEADDDQSPITCPRCDRETPRDREFCVWCQQALSPEATETLDAVTDEATETMVDADERAERELMASLVEIVRENPHRLPDSAQDLFTSSESD